MKTFLEHFLDEVQRKLDASEIDEQRALELVGALKERLEEYAMKDPSAPIVQVPATH